MFDKTLEYIYSVLADAGSSIMQVYGSPDFNIKTKTDNSPVTRADYLSDEILKKGLEIKYPGIPVITEESVGYDSLPQGLPADCWIVDPLDGTKDFIARNDEFCICLARFHNGELSEGYIYVPVTSVMWFAARGMGAWKYENNKAKPLPLKDDRKVYTVLKSRSHMSDEDYKWMNRISSVLPTRDEPQGSAIKFGRIAEGSGDIYLKSGIINKWDVAAGMIIVSEAGGGILSVLTGEQLSFESPGVTTDPFIAYGHRIADPAMLLGLKPGR